MIPLIKKCIPRVTRTFRPMPAMRTFRPIYRYVACGISAGFAGIITFNTLQNNGVLATTQRRLGRSYIFENIKKEIDVNKVIKSLEKADPHLTHGIYDIEKVQELFNDWGVSDNTVIYELFSVADWDHTGVINQFQLSAILTLLHDDDATRQSMEEYLFACLNLDNSGFIHKEAFRSIIIHLLMIKYQVFGLAKVYESDHSDDYYNIYENAEMCGLAKFQANQMCKKVFAFGDKSHSDKLYFRNFQYWWHHAASETHEFHLPTDVKLKNTYLYSL